MAKITNFTPRSYQASILKTCKANNTLVCLPTGTGKTKAAILLAIERLNEFPGSKIVVCSPTKPLTNQIKEEFRECTNLDPLTINILTGLIPPEERKSIWKRSSVIVATPQTLENDLEKERITLSDVSLLCIDECHRSRMRFANTGVAKFFFSQSQQPRLLALTASPGSTKESLQEVCDNLQIEAIEIRTEDDEDMKEHMQEKKIDFIRVELPAELKKLRDTIKNFYLAKVTTLKSFGLTKPISIVNKRDLLMMQGLLQQQIRRGNRSGYVGVSLVAQAIKVGYVIELLETQTIHAVKLYLDKVSKEASKAAKNMNTAKEMIAFKEKIEELDDLKTLHPKLIKLKELVLEEIKKDVECKLIVFANFRNTVDEIVSLLKKEGVDARKFVGQANKETSGLKQKEQIELLEEFKDSRFNVLVASSVGEEGLDIPEVSAVIFYEPVASELRRIQRSGRTGRTKPGRVVYLITKNTRDEAYHWASQRKQNKMKDMLYKIQEKQTKL